MGFDFRERRRASAVGYRRIGSSHGKAPMIAAWFVVIEYRLHKKFSPILKDES
jgi:hypothetical protein